MSDDMKRKLMSMKTEIESMLSSMGDGCKPDSEPSMDESEGGVPNNYEAMESESSEEGSSSRKEALKKMIAKKYAR